MRGSYAPRVLMGATAAPPPDRFLGWDSATDQEVEGATALACVLGVAAIGVTLGKFGLEHVQQKQEDRSRAAWRGELPAARVIKGGR